MIQKSAQIIAFLVVISLIENVFALNRQKLSQGLRTLVANKSRIFSGSQFGSFPIVFHDSATNETVVFEPIRDNGFTMRIGNRFEKEFVASRVGTNSSYSIESFRDRGPLLVVNGNEEQWNDRLAKFGFSSRYIKNFGGIVGILALTFHEHLHAYEQPVWDFKQGPRSVCSGLNGDWLVQTQEGTAFLAELLATSILINGKVDLNFVSEQLNDFEEVPSVDQYSVNYYVLPARKLLEIEKVQGSTIARVAQGLICPFN